MRWICWGPDDVIVLDRGYPSAWLVALLNACGVRFVMRCDNDSGWLPAKTFLRSGEVQTCVTLNAPSAADVRDWGCPGRGANSASGAPSRAQRQIPRPRHQPRRQDSAGRIVRQPLPPALAYRRSVQASPAFEAVSGVSQQGPSDTPGMTSERVDGCAPTVLDVAVQKRRFCPPNALGLCRHGFGNASCAGATQQPDGD